MIRFNLNCDQGHEFDAWFRNGDAYDRQAKRGDVRCPDCGSQNVKKAIMAPAIGRRRRAPAAAEAERPEMPPAGVPATEGPTTGLPATGGPATGGPTTGMPTTGAAAAAADTIHVAGKLREALHELRRFIEQHAEHVGPRFADEARRMHRGEAEERSIYGEASDEEAEALREEGIEFGRVPWPKYRHDG
jgi:hypothetical protein